MTHLPLFQSGKFTLNSGAGTGWRINAECLTDEDLKTSAMLLTALLPEFGQVEGVPRGGIALADAMRPYCSPNNSTLLIVDDVWTTGGSWERHRDGRDALGAVIFARGYTPPHITPLWKLDHRLFLENQ